MEYFFKAAGLLVWVVGASAAAGDFCLRPLRFSWSHGLQRFVFAAALGLGLWLLTLFWVGWLVAYTIGTAVVVTAVFSVPAIFYGLSYLQKDENFLSLSRRAREGQGEGISSETPSSRPSPPVGEKETYFQSSTGGLLALLCVFCVALCVAASFAPVAGMADALAYQLNLPKEWVREGKIMAFDFDVNSAFPLLLNAGFGFGLLFQCASFANLLAVWVGVLVGLGVYGWALENTSGKSAWLGAAAFLLTPALYNHLPVPYVDCALTLYTFLSFWALYLWIGSERAAWLGLSGIFCGLALGVKYLALSCALIAGVSILARGLYRRMPLARLVRLVALFGSFVLATCLIWYVRNYALMGNAFYPFLSTYFGGRPSLSNMQGMDDAYGRGYGLLNFATIFWDATFYPLAYAGFGTRWNLLFLGLMPLVIWFVLRNRRSWWLASFALATLVTWFFLSQVMRFLMPFFPLYCVLLAWAWGSLDRGKGASPLRRVLGTWILLVCLWETACLAAHAKPMIQAAPNASSRAQFLLKRESTWAMARWVNDHLPPDAHIVADGEVRFFYFAPRMTRESVLRLFTKYPQWASHDLEVVTFLKNMGFTHAMVRDVMSPGVAPPQDNKPLQVRNIVGNPSRFKPLHETEGDFQGEKIRFRLYEIL